MEILLKELQQNEAVLSIQKKESVLGNLSYMERLFYLRQITAKNRRSC